MFVGVTVEAWMFITEASFISRSLSGSDHAALSSEAPKTPKDPSE